VRSSWALGDRQCAVVAMDPAQWRDFGARLASSDDPNPLPYASGVRTNN